MREQHAERTMKAGALPKDAAQARGLAEQPAGHRNEQDEQAKTLARLRNVTDILRQTGVKF